MEKKETAKKASAASKETKKPATKPVKKTTKEAGAAPSATPRKTAPKKGSNPTSTNMLSHGVGRRKSAVARVWLSRGSGKITVNDKDYGTYFDTEIARLDAATPFRVCPVGTNYNVKVTVSGGGPYSQAGAVRLGIARALVQLHDDVRTTLRQYGLLTVDPRVKERKKYGQPGARRKFQFVKR